MHGQEQTRMPRRDGSCWRSDYHRWEVFKFLSPIVQGSCSLE
uniref:Uncharacterized protein n=1 Tax=Anguilla anguilla TaxID=7936 RepID=A0A0E9V4T5_ANGAN